MDENDRNKISLRVSQKLFGHISDIASCDFSGNKLVTCSTDKTVRIWDIQSDSEYVESLHSPLIGHRYGILSCCFSPFGSLLATTSIDGNIILWKVESGTQDAVLQHPSGQSVRSCCFSPNSAYLATGGEDYLIAIWDVQTRTLLRTLAVHEDIVTCVGFTPDSAYLISGSSDCTLELWTYNSAGHKNLFCLKDVHDLGIVSCDFSPKIIQSDTTASEFHLATCGNDENVKIWKVTCGFGFDISILHLLEGHSANVMCCRFSSNGYLLASVSGDKSVIIWDPKCGQMLEKRTEHSRYVTSCAFSGSSDILVTGSNDKTIIVWKICNKDDTSDVLRVNLSEQNTSRENGSSVSSTPSGQKQISKWSVDDVTNWLKTIDLSEYIENFIANAIDGQELLYLTHHSLESKLGVSPYGHRNKILRGITILKNPSASSYLQLESSDSSIPEEYFCPITQQLMKDPVIAADGHSYERIAISEWLASGKSSSPMTNDQLQHRILTPNHLLKSLIKRYQ